MLSCKEQESGVRGQESGQRRGSRIVILCLLPTVYCLLFSGCRRDMQDQPKTIAYRENSFYKDGSGSRLLVEGTVPRGYLRADRQFFFGKKLSAADLNKEQQYQVGRTSPSNAANPYPDDVAAVPMSISKIDLDPGSEQYK